MCLLFWLSYGQISSQLDDFVNFLVCFAWAENHLWWCYIWFQKSVNQDSHNNLARLWITAINNGNNSPRDFFSDNFFLGVLNLSPLIRFKSRIWVEINLHGITLAKYMSNRHEIDFAFTFWVISPVGVRKRETAEFRWKGQFIVSTHFYSLDFLEHRTKRFLEDCEEVLTKVKNKMGKREWDAFLTLSLMIDEEIGGKRRNGAHERAHDTCTQEHK